MLKFLILLSVVIICHDWQRIRYCEGSDGYRTEEHETGGMTYGRDTSGNSWESHVYNGKEYTTSWRHK